MNAKEYPGEGGEPRTADWLSWLLLRNGGRSNGKNRKGSLSWSALGWVLGYDGGAVAGDIKVNHPLDQECITALQLWIDRCRMGKAGEPMDELTDKAIQELEAFKRRRE